MSTRSAVELSVIAAARRTDQLCEMEDSFEAELVSVLDGRSYRSVASVVAEIAAWLEDEGYVLAWDAKAQLYSVCEEPEGYVAPLNGPVVAGPYGK